jgi:Ribophorin I
MPTEYHLFQEKKSPSLYILEVDFMHAFDKSITEDYVVKIILPEGATNIKLELASDINPDSIEMGKYFGTLDYFGRP